jgi:hypothetical protein
MQSPITRAIQSSAAIRICWPWSAAWTVSASSSCWTLCRTIPPSIVCFELADRVDSVLTCSTNGEDEGVLHARFTFSTTLRSVTILTHWRCIRLVWLGRCLDVCSFSRLFRSLIPFISMFFFLSLFFSPPSFFPSFLPSFLYLFIYLFSYLFSYLFIYLFIYYYLLFLYSMYLFISLFLYSHHCDCLLWFLNFSFWSSNRAHF